MTKSLLRAIVIGMLGAAGAAMATPAAAATYYPKLVNNSAYPVTLTKVSWSGSYNPQIAASVAPRTSSNTATYKTMATSGFGYLEFDASFTNAAGVVSTCSFYLSVSNSTGQVSSVQGVRKAGTPLPSCVATYSGTSVLFTIAEGV